MTRSIVTAAAKTGPAGGRCRCASVRRLLTADRSLTKPSDRLDGLPERSPLRSAKRCDGSRARIKRNTHQAQAGTWPVVRASGDQRGAARGLRAQDRWEEDRCRDALRQRGRGRRRERIGRCHGEGVGSARREYACRMMRRAWGARTAIAMVRMRKIAAMCSKTSHTGRHRSRARAEPNLRAAGTRHRHESGRNQRAQYQRRQDQQHQPPGPPHRQ